MCYLSSAVPVSFIVHTEKCHCGLYGDHLLMALYFFLFFFMFVLMLTANLLAHGCSFCREDVR